jgi:hypothetical protein
MAAKKKRIRDPYSFNFGANRKPRKARKKTGPREWKGRTYGS